VAWAALAHSHAIVGVAEAVADIGIATGQLQALPASMHEAASAGMLIAQDEGGTARRRMQQIHYRSISKTEHLASRT